MVSFCQHYIFEFSERHW